MPPPARGDLATYLFEGVEDRGLAEEFATWFGAAPRFRAFVADHRDKVRKKLRGARDLDALRDVRVELQIARLLLTDRRISLAFEPYGAGRSGPDFTVSVAGEPPFNLEVTRAHGGLGAGGVAAPQRSLIAKLHQLPPSAANVVLISIDGPDGDGFDVDETVKAIRRRADRKDEEFFVVRGFTGTKAFYERFLRLGAVLVYREEAAGAARVSAWVNRSARIGVSDRAFRAAVLAVASD